MSQPSLLPLVRRFDSPEFAEQDPRSEASPLTQPLVGDLLIAFAFPLPGGLQWLTRGQFGQLGLTPDQLRRQSQDYFLRGIKQLKGQPLKASQLGLERLGLEQEEILLTTLTTGNHREASLLLLDHVWSQLAEQLQDEVVVAIPSESRLMFTGLKNSTGLLAMARLAGEAFRESATQALSPDLFVWRNGWQTLASPLEAAEAQAR